MLILRDKDEVERLRSRLLERCVLVLFDSGVAHGDRSSLPCLFSSLF